MSVTKLYKQVRFESTSRSCVGFVHLMHVSLFIPGRLGGGALQPFLRVVEGAKNSTPLP